MCSVIAGYQAVYKKRPEYVMLCSTRPRPDILLPVEDVLSKLAARVTTSKAICCSLNASDLTMLMTSDLPKSLTMVSSEEGGKTETVVVAAVTSDTRRP